MKKGNKTAGLVIGAIILTIVALPFVFLSYALYFAWDSQESGEFYKPAFEKDGNLYDLNMQGNTLAFDEGEPENHIYLNSPYILGELVGLSYGDFTVEKTDNPYFSGKISFGHNKYHKSETKYRNPKDTYQAYEYYDQNRNLIFAYEPGMESEFVVKLRPTFPAFSKRRYGIGNKRDYIDATKLLKAKLGKNLRFRIDETNKLLVFRFE